MYYERVQELLLYNDKQILLLDKLYYNQYMGIDTTPEMLESLKEIFISLRRLILKPIVRYLRTRETIGRHVNVLLPNILNALIVGERGTGKSHYIKSLKCENFGRYTPISSGTEPHLIYKKHSDPNKSLGSYFNFRLLTANDKFPNSSDLFEHANVAFIFYNTNILSSYRKIPEWIDKILSVVPNCNIFICANVVRPEHPNIPNNIFYVHNRVKYLQSRLYLGEAQNFHDPIDKTLMHFESEHLIRAN